MQRGFDLPTQNLIQGKVPVIYSNGILKYHNEYKCIAPGLITGRSGTIGKFTYIETGEYWPHNTTLWVTDFYGNYPLFIYYLYQSVKLEQFSTGSGVPTLNRNDVHKKICFIPTILEQQKMASFLSLIDNRIRTQNKTIDQLETLIKGASEKLLTQKLRFKEFNDDWKVKVGSEIFANISDKNHNSDLPILAITQEHGAIPRNFIDYNIAVSEKSINGYKVIQKGDFIISLRSFQGGIEYSEYHGICSPAYIVLRPIIPVNKIFFKYYFKTDSYIFNLNKKLEGIRDGKMISYKYFSEIPLPLPTFEEQTKIANFLSTIDSKIKTEKKILEQLEKQKKYFLQQMFC